MKGKVKYYSIVKGSGMIQGDDGNEYKVKMAGIKGTGLKKLNEDQIVNFEANGSSAVEVEPA